MSSRATLHIALWVAVLAGAAPVMAANTGFMRDTAFSYFNEADLKLFEAAFQDALNKAAVGETRTWANAKTRSSGEIKLIGTFERDGQSCRTLNIANKAKTASGSADYRFCKQASGKWALIQ